MGERSVAQSRASVMIYNNDNKKWEHAGGSQGISRVHVYFNPANDSYRIVGRKMNDNEVVINCSLGRSLKYNKATPTFHQWRDQRQVYGLNFQSPEDADIFSEAVLGAVDFLTNPPPKEELHYAVSNPIEIKDEPVRPNGYDAHAGTQYQRFQDDPSQQYGQPVEQPTIHQQAPKAPEPLSSAPPTFQTTSNVPVAPPLPPTLSGPPSTPAPPPVPQGGGVPQPPPLPPSMSSGGAPPAPPPPPPGPGGGVPPPPPPPPPPPSSGGAMGGNTLANALQGVTLKSRSEVQEDRRPAPQTNPMDDMMSALQRRLKARKEAADSGGTTNVSPPSQAPASKASVPPPAAEKKPKSNTNTFPRRPFNHSSSLTSSSEPAKSSPEPVKSSPEPVKSSQEPVKSSSASASDLESIKQEILDFIREEISTAKEEIIDAMRDELQKLSS